MEVLGFIRFITIFTVVAVCNSQNGNWNPTGKLTLTNDGFSVDFADPSAIQIYYSMYNGALSVSYNVLDANKISKDLMVDVQVSSYDGRQYNPIVLPFTTKQNFCTFLKSEKMIMPDMMAKFSPKPTGCPWGAGWWNMTGYVPNSDRLPPMIPTGKYKLTMTFTQGANRYYATSWYGSLTKK